MNSKIFTKQVLANINKKKNELIFKINFIFDSGNWINTLNNSSSKYSVKIKKYKI